MNNKNFKDLKVVPKTTREIAPMVVSNAVHLATLLKAKPCAAMAG